MSERRREARWTQFAGCTVGVDGNLSRIKDLSSMGARVQTGRKLAMDEVVRLDLPWGVPVAARVIDCAEDSYRFLFSYAVEID